MHALSITLNTKSMVKPHTHVYFVTQLHKSPHAEPDKTISHFILHIILHHKMVTLSRFPMRQYRKKTFSANFILKCSIQFILIKVLRVLKSLERRKIPVKKSNTMYILDSSYQYYFLRTVFGYIAFEKQSQQHFSRCESYLREREREREREVHGESLMCPPSLTDT